jgi:LmbE family N-acetylglucosaminyl deacetylase
MPAIVEHAIAGGWTAPPKGFWSLTPNAFGLGAEPPTMIVDVAAWTARKIAAIRCHRSQTESNGPFARLTDEDARRWLGVEHFHRALTGGSQEPVLESLLCT